MMEYTEITTTNTYMYLYRTALMNLNELNKCEDGYLCKIITIIMFTSFTIESYMNHIGEEQCDFWNEIERNRPLEKLKILFSILDIDFDKSQRPIQSIIEMFNIRNKLAHAKTETNTKTFKVDQDIANINHKEIIGQAKPEWEQKATKKNAQRYFDDMKKILELLHAKTNSKYPSPFIEISSSSGEGKVISQNFEEKQV